MRIDVFTIFPGLVDAFCAESLLGKARQSGLLDLRPVPLSGTFPGVELNATVLDNVLHESFMRPVPHLVSVLSAILFLGLVSLVRMRAEKTPCPSHSKK